METKYIVGFGRAGFTWQSFAVLFPECVTHSDMAVAIFGDKSCVLGAGFVSVGASGASVYGRSDSLNLRARLEDNLYVDAALGGEPVSFDQRNKDELQAREASTRKPPR